MMVNFLYHNWADTLLVGVIFFLSVLPVIPPTFAGLNKEYYDTFFQKMKKQKKLNLWELIVHLISHVVVSGPALALGLRGTVTLVLFLVIGMDLYLNKRISDNAVVIAIIGIVALYLETFLNTADEISIWKLVTWKAKKTVTASRSVPSDEPAKD